MGRDPTVDNSIKAAGAWDALTPGTNEKKEYRGVHIKTTAGLFTVVSLDGDEMEFYGNLGQVLPLRFSYIKVGAAAAGFVGLNT
jgi:hypothetical protein